MRRIACLLLLLALTAAPRQGWTASSPGGDQTNQGKNNNTAGIIAVGAVGVAIVGGLLWWHFHRAPGSEGWDEVIIRKPQGPVPALRVADFQGGSPQAEKAHPSKKIRGLLIEALKHSQAYMLQDVSANAKEDSGLVLTGKVSLLSNFSQLEVTVSRKGESIFNQTLTWFEDRELRKQVAQLVNQITEKVK